MSSKHVYFVRHGESVANATGIRQGAETPLTELGRRQALCVGKRLSGMRIKRIVKSPFVRARETSELIEQELPGVPVTESALFVERRNPSVMVGTMAGDPEMEHAWRLIAENYHVSGWHHSDEENFDDLVGRAKEVLTLLEGLLEKNILVVSHGMFMKVLFARVLLGDNLNGRIFWDQFVPAKNVANTGMMHLEYTENFHKTGKYWKLVSWNDHAHLKELPELA